jgi:hypothetical protein
MSGLRERIGALGRRLRRTRGLGRLVALGSSWKSRAAERRWVRVYRNSYERPVRFDLLSGTIRSAAIPVVMCLWNRPFRIADIVESLDAQLSERPIRLIFWNNQRSDDAVYRASIAATRPHGAVASIEYRASPVNLGGIGRFIAVRQLVRDGYDGPFIMLDDDEVVSDSFVSDLLAGYSPRTYAGWWAWVNQGSYNVRTAAVPGGPATYVGTGGAICDSALVTTPGFFDDLPPRYAFVEDLWASHVAKSLDWTLTKIETPIELILEESNQYRHFGDRKTEFFDILQAGGPNERA